MPHIMIVVSAGDRRLTLTSRCSMLCACMYSRPFSTSNAMVATISSSKPCTSTQCQREMRKVASPTVLTFASTITLQHTLQQACLLLSKHLCKSCSSSQAQLKSQDTTAPLQACSKAVAQPAFRSGARALSRWQNWGCSRRPQLWCICWAHLRVLVENDVIDGAA